jgi:cell division septation protein DedD
MASTTHDEGFHEIQLNGKQLVFLFMAGTVVAVVIFLLGVFVGRGVRAASPEPPALASDTAPTAAPEIPPVATSSGSNAPATTNEKLEYAERLAGDPPKDTLSKPAPATAAAPASAAAGASADKTAGKPAPGAPSAPGAPGLSVPVEPAGDGFSIQLAALAKRDEAEGIVRRLTGKGYSAYLIAPAAGAPTVYRVRVGKFKERREAESVSARLQKEEQFKPWIVR